MEKEKLKEQFDLLKKEMEDIRNDETIKKYEILSKAYNLGKEIYGHQYSYFRLAFDFEMGYTTVKRICSLDRASFVTWKLIKDKKISSFKVAQILHQHGPTYQDELIRLVIDNDLSTYEIRNLRAKSLDDIKKARLRIAVDRGFARKHVALKSFTDTIDRMLCLMTIEKENLPQKKLPELKRELEKLIKKTKKFSEEIGASPKP